MPESTSDNIQIRRIVDQIMEATADRREAAKVEVPAPLKWAGAVVAGLFTAGTATLAFWVVSSISEMQVTLARVDERMTSGSIKDGRFDELERRINKNEAAIAELKK